MKWTWLCFIPCGIRQSLRRTDFQSWGSSDKRRNVKDDSYREQDSAKRIRMKPLYGEWVIWHSYKSRLPSSKSTLVTISPINRVKIESFQEYGILSFVREDRGIFVFQDTEPCRLFLKWNES
jgi:hypothetical protein